MKKLLLIFLILSLLVGCGAPAVEEPAETEEVVTVPDEEVIPLGTFTAQALTGAEYDEQFFSSADLTIINTWATYCGPCKQEMPILGMLDRELENVQVLGIVTDVLDQQANPDPNQVELALELHKAYECDYPSLILNYDLAMLGFASLPSVPATLFVDREGNLVGKGFYGALDETGWRQEIAKRLEMIGQ